MANFVKDFIQSAEKQFLKNKKYIEVKDWTVEKEDVEEENFFKKNKRRLDEFNLQNDLASGILERVKYFVKKTSGVKRTKKALDFIKDSLNIVELHTNRVDFYINNMDISEIEESSMRADEVAFHNHCFKAVSKLMDNISGLDVNYEDETNSNTSGIEFLNNSKAPLSMHNILSKLYPQINNSLKEKGIDFESKPDNKLLFLNPKPPEWDVNLHYWEQDKKTLQFYVDEFKKLQYGIVIDGVYFSPWAYYHLNVFITPIPHKEWDENSQEFKSKDYKINPPLRDSDWMIFENRNRQIKEKHLMMFIAATRRAAKTTAESSILGHGSTIGLGELLCAGSSSKDLNQIRKNFKVDNENKNPAFAVPVITNDWKDKVEFGIKTKSNKSIILSTLYIINTDGGNSKEIFAGFTPDLLVYDEVMKSAFIESLEGALPALRGLDGTVRCFPILSGCVCAGTKVFTKKGKLVNIEDLQQSEGILGQGLKGVYKSNISWMKPPAKKPCYKITTTCGMTLECSDDHPILTAKITNPKNAYFEKACDLKEHSLMFIPEKVDVFGDVYEPDARLLGLLVGDGYNSLSGSELYLEGEGVFNWLNDNYKNTVMKTFQTKVNSTFRRIYIKNSAVITKRAGIAGKVSTKKTLPLDWSEYDKSSLKELIGGLFDSDGSVSHNSKGLRYRYRSISKAIVYELQTALLKLGIHSSVSLSNEKKTKIKGKEYDRKPIYELSISSKHDATLFYNTIRLYSENKILKDIDLTNLKGRHKPSTLRSIKQSNGKGNYFKNTKDIGNFRRVSVVKVEYIGEKEVYNLTADTTHTYLANNFVTHNTGGSEELSADGWKVLASPEVYDVMPMQWDLLEKGVPKEAITWEEDKAKPFGTFLPGQCRVDMPKIDSNLAEYLEVDSEYLKKVPIKLTDWVEAKRVIEQRRDLVAGDKIKHQKEVVYSPITPSDIFLSGALNPFPVAEAKAHKQYLIETGKWDKRRSIYRDSMGKICFDISTKALADFPHKGGNVDAPALIFEYPPEQPVKFGTFTAGFDDYKHESSDSSSVSTFYIFKNEILGDPYSKKVVASISFRPDRHSNVHEKWLMLMEAYNLEATCFGENEDMAIKDYLDKKHLTEKYLAQGLDFSQTFNLANNLRRKYGWSPQTSKKTLFRLFVEYCNEEFVFEMEDGTMKTMKGVQRIDDIGLLDEIIQYNTNLNVDRITAMMGAVGYAHYLTSSFLFKPPTYTNETDKGTTKRVQKKREKSFYGGNERNKSFYSKGRR